jgi:hypothetical protein
MDTGWLTASLATALLGFDLDRKRLDDLVKIGIVDTRTDGSILRFKLADVCSFTVQTSQQLLNRHFPYNRQRDPDAGQQLGVLDTRAKRDAFRRKWDRLHKAVSEWIASPEEDFSAGELRLIHQLLTRARKVSGFELILKAKLLEQVTGLDDEALPKARRSLERRGILQTERSGTVAWRYRLCDPATRQPLTDDDDNTRIKFVEEVPSWW